MVTPIEGSETGRRGLRDVGAFYMSMLQEVLLFGFDMWVMSPRIGRRMGEFNHLLIHRLMVWQPICLVYGIWVYPPLEVAMEEADLE